MPCELHVRDDVAPQRNVVVQRRTSKAGMQLARDGASADRLGSFENDRLEPRLRQIERRRQPIVPGADDDDVRSGECLPESCSAAFRPGAPMMPPPGCVAEPHM